LGERLQGGSSVETSNVEVSLASELRLLDLIQCISDGVTRLMSFDSEASYWVGMSVRESVTNAILHGNKMDETKRVRVAFRMNPESLVIIVRDEGAGFDESRLPDPLNPTNLLRPSGRGIFYIRTFMDDVRFGLLPEGGFELRMEKRLNHKEHGEQKGEGNED
jgi:serine/threonine-protein kinase RsbW